MRNTHVREISLDRRRSGIIDRSNPMHSQWRVFFRLTPYPSREWDRILTQQILQGRQNGQLRYEYLIVRETRRDSGLGPRRPGIFTRMWRRMRRGEFYGVEVRCASRADELHGATHELAGLVARANQVYVQAKESANATVVATRIANDRLANALESIDRQLRKTPIRPELAAFSPSTESVFAAD